MNNEEAIQVLKGMKRALKERDFRSEHEALNMAIEALSADAVSRVDVTNTSENLDEEDVSANAVQGEWIKYESPVDHDDGKDAWDCSLCGAMVGKRTNFCPNCGADMRVQKVSEEKSEYLDKIFPHEEKGEWYDVTKLIEYANMKREKF